MIYSIWKLSVVFILLLSLCQGTTAVPGTMLMCRTPLPIASRQADAPDTTSKCLTPGWCSWHHCCRVPDAELMYLTPLPSALRHADILDTTSKCLTPRWYTWRRFQVPDATLIYVTPLPSAWLRYIVLGFMFKVIVIPIMLFPHKMTSYFSKKLAAWLKQW